MTSRYEIPVPGSFAPGVALLDLETSKVPTPDGYRMPNGEPLKRRWRIVMAGVARDGVVTILDGDDEAYLLDDLGSVLADSREVAYSGTREFDEMICRGRFTNARRAHLPVPTFPAVPGAEDLHWVNLKVGHPVRRDPRDLPGYDVTRALNMGHWEAVAVHNLRDVAELILVAGNPTVVCRVWCRRVMADYDFALSEIYGADD